MKCQIENSLKSKKEIGGLVKNNAKVSVLHLNYSWWNKIYLSLTLECVWSDFKEIGDSKFRI